MNLHKALPEEHFKGKTGEPRIGVVRHHFWPDFQHPATSEVRFNQA
jgi:hypothetical protein